jgi:hypothetical protein
VLLKLIEKRTKFYDLIGGYPNWHAISNITNTSNNFVGYIYSFAIKNKSDNKYSMYDFSEKHTIIGFNVDKPFNH